MIENNGARMSTNFTLNEPPPMVRDRLQEAYQKIIFISDNDFAQDQNYRKANQVLYARIKKLEETKGTDRPRIVGDVIPNSNLAKYGRYEYNESRERSYTSGPSEVSLHYPCIYKNDHLKEPWMLPEVEQIFVHTAFAGTFNFTMYEAELEQLHKIDLLEGTVVGRPVVCCPGDFHKINPLLDQMFERAPGKKFGKWQDLDIVANMPYYFNVKEYDDVLLRNKILSDIVRELWKAPKTENVDKLFKVYKTSLDNVFVDDNYKCAGNLKSVDTEKNLQQLVDSLLCLSDRVPKEEASSKRDEDMAQPVRRLYSDVVQGNKSPSKHQDMHTPTKLAASKETLLTFHSLETSPVLSPQREMRSDDELRSPDIDKKFSYSDAVNNSNVLLNDFSVYENNFRGGSSASNFQNFYNPIQYIPNAVYNANNYRMNYAQCNQAMSANRSNMGAVQSPWFFPSYRPPSLCTYGNFLGQLLVPQMPTKHRWSNPHYGRPQTPQNIYQPINPNWQNVYRSNSTQQMHYQYEPKVKQKKMANPVKFQRSKTPDPSAASKPKFSGKKPSQYPGKILTKPNSDFKLMTRQDGVRLVGSERSFDMDPPIPVVCSASEELEKIALREYQSSNDMFFNEIERQAEEQYDGNPENSCCPPSKLVGGHATMNVLFVCVDVY